MRDILFVKTSSLGDVIHHMPAVSDARRLLPEARISWMVEDSYAPLVRMHPAVHEVVPVAVRRWRRHPFARPTWREARGCLRVLRRHRYDAVIDTQGLVRSALLARLARGPRHGYAPGSIREPLASLLYDVRHMVDRNLHAVERNRMLTARALGYAAQGEPDYGLAAAALDLAASPYAVLLHGSAKPEKKWREEHWVALGAALNADGLDVVLPWGTAAEQERSRRMAAKLSRARVCDRQPLDRLARLISGASIVVGLDTGLLHLAAACAVPLTAIFIGSEPRLTGPRGAGPMTVVGGKGLLPDVEEAVAAARRTLVQARSTARGPAQ
jgi:heptosyltransferase-1